MVRRGRPAIFPTRLLVIADAYGQKKFDEFIIPAVIGDYAGMRDGEGILCFNFRADRVREISGRDARSGVPADSSQARGQASPGAVGMTQYSTSSTLTCRRSFVAVAHAHPR